MNLFTGKVRTICMCNVMVPFVCTGFLGIKTTNGIVTGSTTDEAHEISLTASDTEPASQYGEGEENKYAFVVDGIEAVINQQEFTGPQAIQEEDNDFAFITKSIKAIIEQQKSTTEEKSTTKTTTKKTTAKKTTSSSRKKTTSVVTKKEVSSSKSYSKPSYSKLTGDVVVSFAKQFMGLKYVHAGRSLKTGTDCSGFTMLIYREFGVSLPPTVGGQIGKGSKVAKKDLQKGDLVFYKAKGSKGGASHVGIYIGGGQVIHESRPGVGVKISTVNMMQYVTARRVINSKAIKIAEQKVAEQNAAQAKADTTTNNTEATTTATPSINNSEKNEIVNNNVASTSTPATATPTPIAIQTETKQEVKADAPKEEAKVETKVEVKEESNKEEVNSNTESN